MKELRDLKDLTIHDVQPYTVHPIHYTLSRKPSGANTVREGVGGVCEASGEILRRHGPCQENCLLGAWRVRGFRNAGRGFRVDG